jgi:hypothetical protein
MPCMLSGVPVLLCDVDVQFSHQCFAFGLLFLAIVASRSSSIHMVYMVPPCRSSLDSGFRLMTSRISRMSSLPVSVRLKVLNLYQGLLLPFFIFLYAPRAVFYPPCVFYLP